MLLKRHSSPDRCTIERALEVLRHPSFLTAALLLVPGALAAQDPVRVARPARIASVPHIDGRLDEAVWQQAEPLTGFVQRQPREGAPSTELTEVRILTDGEALYVGAWLFDRDPAAIVHGERVRDVDLTNSDYVAIIFDTFADRQNGFVFGTTPTGIEYDGQVIKEGEGGGVFQQGQSRAQAGSAGGFNLNWDASWTVATSVDSLGWYAEFRIPFATLRYGNARQQTWGLNVARGIRRRNEESFWSPIPLQYSLYRVSRAGHLVDLDVPRQRIATVTPYVLTSAQHLYSADSVAAGWDSTNFPNEIGVDAKLGITPSLTLDATYNTDFAQVEVDQQQTNLTRFPLFFPEKRPFFLENAGVFSAGTPQAVEMFFSRRIGIDTLGNPVPIAGGGRLTGKVAGLTVGVLQLFTEREAGIQPANSYSVSRVLREWGRSRIGVLAVHRLATRDGRDRNTTLDADGRLALSDPVTLDWWVAQTNTPGRTGRDAAFSGRLGFKNSRWDNGLRFAQVGEDFNPEVGFLSRSGYRYYEPSVFYTMPLRHRYLRYWLPHASYRGYFGFDGAVQSDWLHLDLGQAELNNGGQIGPEVNIYREGLTQPFDIATGVTLPAGVYHWTSLGFDFGTNPSAPLAFLTKLQAGQFYNGTLYGWTSTTTVRGSSLTASLQFDYNRVRLDQGNFVRSLVGLRLGYFFTPRMFVQSLVQYNNQAAVFSANVRFGWLNTAGTGLFVVLNTADTATELFAWRRPMTRSLQVKFTRQFGTGG
ncbi:MAG TPA: DUF5916 domain-containing protein [Gemmatimonadales bacterium]